MTHGDLFVAAARNVAEIMKEIRALVREEREYATSAALFPENRDTRFLEKSRRMERAVREMRVRFRGVEESGGERERAAALRIMNGIREGIQETMRLTRDIRSVVQQQRDEAYREVQTVRQNEKALRVYGSNRGTYNGGKMYGNQEITAI